MQTVEYSSLNSKLRVDELDLHTFVLQHHRSKHALGFLSLSAHKVQYELDLGAVTVSIGELARCFLSREKVVLLERYTS